MLSESPRRPPAVLVIGCGALGVGLLLLAGGVGLAVESEQIVEHQILVGLIEVALAAFVIGAGWALLRLRVWGAVAQVRRR